MARHSRGSHAPQPQAGMRPVQVPSQAPAKRGGAWRVVFWIALVVLLACVAALGVLAWTYWHADHDYKQIASQAAPELAQDASASQMQLSDMTVDWDYLRQTNADVVAWVYMPGTRINYPVCHTDDDQYYLDTDFNGNRNIATRSGTIFLDAADKPDFSSQNNVLYGHHMNDGSMFACISTQLADQDGFNANRTIYVLTPSMNYECTTFALILTTGTDRLVQTQFSTSADMAAYIADKEARSVVTPSEGMPDPSSITKLFTFSTCDYTQDNGRAVMFAEPVAQAVPGSGTQSPAVDAQDMAQVQQGEQDAA